jgi:hypothetical protein
VLKAGIKSRLFVNKLDSGRSHLSFRGVWGVGCGIGALASSYGVCHFVSAVRAVNPVVELLDYLYGAEYTHILRMLISRSLKASCRTIDCHRPVHTRTLSVSKVETQSTLSYR